MGKGPNAGDRKGRHIGHLILRGQDMGCPIWPWVWLKGMGQDKRQQWFA